MYCVGGTAEEGVRQREREREKQTQRETKIHTEKNIERNTHTHPESEKTRRDEVSERRMRDSHTDS